MLPADIDYQLTLGDDFVMTRSPVGGIFRQNCALIGAQGAAKRDGFKISNGTQGTGKAFNNCGAKQHNLNTKGSALSETAERLNDES